LVLFNISPGTHHNCQPRQRSLLCSTLEEESSPNSLLPCAPRRRGSLQGLTPAFSPADSSMQPPSNGRQKIPRCGVHAAKSDSSLVKKDTAPPKRRQSDIPRPPRAIMDISPTFPVRRASADHCSSTCTSLAKPHFEAQQQTRLLAPSSAYLAMLQGAFRSKEGRPTESATTTATTTDCIQDCLNQIEDVLVVHSSASNEARPRREKLNLAVLNFAALK
jgi:hypothetical protein